MNSAKTKTAISIAIFVAFIFLIEYYLGWASILSPWEQVSAPSLLAAFALVFISYLARAYRIYFFYQTESRIKLLPCLKLTLLHNFYNNLLPMRSGELAFPLLMSKYFSIPVNRSVPGLLWFRILDLHSLGLVALASLLLAPLGLRSTILVILPFLAIPWLLYRWTGWLLEKLHPNTGGRLAAFAFKFLHGLPSNQGQFWICWIWTLTNWAVKLTAFAWIFTFFVEAPISQAIIGIIGAELTSVLPIHGVAGAGTYEAGAVAALLPFGLNAKAILAGAVNLHLFLLSATLLTGLFAMLMPVPERAQDKSE